MSKPIGKITGTYRNERIAATLDETGRWVCSNKSAELYLNTKYSLKGEYGSPSMGAWGSAAVHDAAADLNGNAEYLIKIDPAANKGKVY